MPVVPRVETLILSFTLLLFVNPAFSAQDSRGESWLSQWGLQYGYGQAGFTGELSSDKAFAFHDLQVSWLHLSSKAWPLKAHLAVNVLSMSGPSTESPFPFPSGERLSLLGFFFIPTLCTQAIQVLDLCFGIGQGTLNVNTNLHQRDYGTWNYQAMVKYHLTPNWRAVFLWKYVGKVEQKVAGTDSYFALQGLALGVEWLSF